MTSLEIKKRITEILQKGYIMSLGTLDTQGVWVADVIYIHDEYFNLYWMSFKSARHSQALKMNDKVAATITISGPNKPDLGLQIAGIASIISGPHPDLALSFRKKRHRPLNKSETEVLSNRNWYCLKPTKIELIDKQNFGYEKKQVNL